MDKLSKKYLSNLPWSQHMKDPDIQKQDKLKLLQLLSEIRRMGLEIDEPIKTKYLNLSPDVGES